MNRQIRSYSLLFLFLFGALVPSQAQQELTRLPILWKHFQTHNVETSNLDFLDFLQLHYGKGFAQHRTAHDHSKLPMKTGNGNLQPPVPVDLPKPIEIMLHAVSIGRQPLIFEDQILPQSFLHDIWQPPRSC